MSDSTLSSLKIGDSALITSIAGNDNIRRRLMEMGLIPGTEVKALRRAPFGDPIEVQVMHYHLTLRLNQADLVSLGTLTETQHNVASIENPQAIASDKHSNEIKRIALLGNPNCGKTSLFNSLTGLRQKVGNYPGVTVEKRSGSCPLGERTVQILDLPGTYSLSPNSPDERITTDVLKGGVNGTDIPDALIIVLDACNLARNLYLFTQAVDLQLPIVVALSMYDIAEKEGIHADTKSLQELLGVPVTAVNCQNGHGIDALKTSLAEAAVPKQRVWDYPEKIESACRRLGLRAEESKIVSPYKSSQVFGERLLSGADPIIPYATPGNEEFITWYQREIRLLKTEDLDINEQIIRTRYAWIEAICKKVLPEQALQSSGQNLNKFSLKLDSFLVHRFFGLIAFIAIMATVFISVFIIAAPIMDLFEGALLSFGDVCFGGMEDGPLKDLILNGIIAGAGGVVIFVPQIAILSLFLALLEDSGYLARASFLMDRLLAFCGLHGKSFVPLLTAHACAIPAIIATRSMEHRRDRLATIFVAPFMACGARLPVYALLTIVFFSHYSALGQGLILLSLYALGIVAAAATAIVTKMTALKGPSPAFIIEFPSYRIPQWSQVARVVGRNSWLFCRKAGTIILAFSICLWAMLYYPRLDDSERERIAVEHQTDLVTVRAHLDLADEVTAIEEDENLAENDKQAQLAAFYQAHEINETDIENANIINKAWIGEQSRQSIAGTGGHMLEPIISPMGYDWKIGVGLIGAFAAREVFVATMGTIYSAGDEADENDKGLHAAMRNAKREDGSPIWTTPVALSLFVFFAIAMQCISTVAIVKQETGTWIWPLVQLAYMNILAFVLATLVYQIGTALS